MVRCNFLPLIRLIAVGAFALTAGSCQRIYPVRTLPNWVRGVYVPMAQNKSTEPALEEILTQYTQEEFLADGRLTVKSKHAADVQIAATVLSWDVTGDRRDNDHISGREELEVVTDVTLLDPTDDPFNPHEPIAKLPPIKTRYGYNSDPRSTSFVIEPELKREVLNLIARQIVDMTINGFPLLIKDQPGGVHLPEGTQVPGPSPRGNIFRNRRSLD